MEPNTRPYSIMAAARIAHDANAALCRVNDDFTQVAWEMAPDWQKYSAISGVRFQLANPDAPASASHDNWMAEKVAAGWVYGLTKDADNKRHPCIVAFDRLPPRQQVKDHLFKATVAALAPFIDDRLQ